MVRLGAPCGGYVPLLVGFFGAKPGFPTLQCNLGFVVTLFNDVGDAMKDFPLAVSVDAERARIVLYQPPTS